MRAARSPDREDHHVSAHFDPYRRFGACGQGRAPWTGASQISGSKSHRIDGGTVVVDADKIEANFKNGVLTVTLPKTEHAQKSEKKIAIKKA